MRRFFFGLALAFSSAAALASGSQKGAWIFLKSDGDVGVLSASAQSLHFPDTTFETSFCTGSSAFKCFKSDLVEFAIPSKLEGSWSFGGRIYCLRRRMALGGGDSMKGDLLFITSALGSSCESAIPDETFLYSIAHGLRYISIRKEQFNVDLISLDEDGFGR
jgi:hypothetical protein